MTISKSDERAAMEAVATILTPLAAHVDSYGIGAMMDNLYAWQRAIDTDTPMECHQRDRQEAAAAKKSCDEECQRRLAAAQQEAERIITNASQRAERVSALVNERMRALVKAAEAI